MTYNVWSREDVAVYTRMKAIGSLVEKHKPDVIFFQMNYLHDVLRMCRKSRHTFSGSSRALRGGRSTTAQK
ncbi:hypothetical protein EE612_039505 [Oryza sativa]|nr:hypothetical protein EE612_039505 [Oryza sativa]